MGRIVLEEQLRLLLHDAKACGGDFKRNTYEQLFDDLYIKHVNTMVAIEELFHKENDNEALFHDLSTIFPSIALEKVNALPKRKQELAILDYNMAMVTFVIPVIMKRRAEYMEDFADQCVESWNKSFPKNKIGKANNSEIQGGFKTSLCYITTAVCNTLDMADDCYELNTLRDYRDHYLLNTTTDGADVVKQYYDMAPTIVKRINKQENAKEVYQELWKVYLNPCIHFIENKEMEETKELYTKMVNELKIQYFH